MEHTWNKQSAQQHSHTRHTHSQFQLTRLNWLACSLRVFNTNARLIVSPLRTNVCVQSQTTATQINQRDVTCLRLASLPPLHMQCNPVINSTHSTNTHANTHTCFLSFRVCCPRRSSGRGWGDFFTITQTHSCRGCRSRH